MDRCSRHAPYCGWRLVLSRRKVAVGKVCSPWTAGGSGRATRRLVAVAAAAAAGTDRGRPSWCKPLHRLLHLALTCGEEAAEQRSGQQERHAAAHSCCGRSCSAAWLTGALLKSAISSGLRALRDSTAARRRGGGGGGKARPPHAGIIQVCHWWRLLHGQPLGCNRRKPTAAKTSFPCCAGAAAAPVNRWLTQP